MTFGLDAGIGFPKIESLLGEFSLIFLFRLILHHFSWLVLTVILICIFLRKFLRVWRIFPQFLLLSLEKFRQLNVIAEELVCSYFGSVLAEPLPKFSKAPTLVDPQVTEIGHQYPQRFRVALPCEPKVDPPKQFLSVEPHVVDVVEVTIVVEDSRRKQGETQREQLCWFVGP